MTSTPVRRLCASFEPLESRVLMAVTADIEGVQNAALDMPRVNVLLRRGGATGTPLETPGGETFNIEAFYDTGASGILLSEATADGLGVTRARHNNQLIEFEDVGVGGSSFFNVSEALHLSIAPYPNADTEDPAGYTQTLGPYRTQIGPLSAEPIPGLEGLDVFGMPAMAGKVVVMDPKPLNDEENLDVMRTYVYNPGTPFRPAEAQTNPGIPQTNLRVDLSYASFARFTDVSPAGAPGPSLRNNPFIGPNPVLRLDPNPPADNTPPISISRGTRTETGSWLLDTGAAASILSQGEAAKVGVTYAPGSYQSDNPRLVDSAGNPIADQFTITIGGIGGSFQAAGFFLDSLTIPTMEGTPIRYLGAPVLVGDITVEDPDTGQSLTLDGILGMNYLVASIFVTETPDPIFGDARAGAFDWLVFDEPNGVLGLQLPGFTPPTDTVRPTAALIASNVTTGGGTTHTFSVRYADDVAVNTTTIDSSDVRVRLPNGTTVPVTLTGVTGGAAGSPVTASYRFTAPGGTWNAADNGTYTVVVQTNQIADTAGNFVNAITPSTFQVAVPTTGTISGTVFHDVNANAVRDAGEPAQANWRVYIDADRDGVFDSTERNTLTNSAGAYSFTSLPAGTHRAREVVQSGFRISTPSALFHDVTLAGGQAATGRNFGNTQRVLITGTSYNDTSGNGSRVSTEPGIVGRTIYIDADNDGVLDSTEARTTTDASGKYTFKAQRAGTLRVREVLPAGWRRTQPSTSSNGGSYVLTLGNGASATARDFGSTQKVLITGSVFNDANGDRVRQSTETRLANWRIYVDKDNDGVLETGESSTLTDASGNWRFTGLAAGSYVIRVVQQTGFTRTTPTAGSFTLTLTTGQTRTGLFFGERRTG